MNKLGTMLTKYRNAFLLLLLVTTLAVSCMANRERLSAASSTVDIPLTEVSAQALSALETYRQQRDQETLSDIAALEKVCSQVNLAEKTREDAAAQLQAIIDSRQGQTALEGALTCSSLYPCVAVVSGGNVTIVTEKTSVTDQDTALVITLAAAHVGASPEDIRIITAN